MKANTYTKICFNLGNGKDILDMSLAMNLSVEEKGFIDKLKVGEAIIGLKGRFYEKIHVKFDKFKIKKGFVSDNLVKELTGSYFKDILAKSSEIENSKEFQELLTSLKLHKKAQPTPGKSLQK